MDIEIVSGEGTGEGHIEDYEGDLTATAIVEKLEEERCAGDRWAYVKIDGERVEDRDLERVLRNS